MDILIRHQAAIPHSRPQSRRRSSLVQSNSTGHSQGLTDWRDPPFTIEFGRRLSVKSKSPSAAPKAIAC